ncbi:MAG: peroxiredoxin-like family protein [Cyanobacteria bacterium P01_C01_bin.69]
MTLKAQLDAFKAEFIEKFPTDKAAIMEQATAALEKTFAPALKVGDSAPEFTLPNATGKQASLTEALREGPVILNFYRGGWCPYCNLELRAYQQVLPKIKAAGASLLAISPQAPDTSLSTAEKNELEFEVLSDQGSNVAESYGLAFTLPDELQKLYTELNHVLPKVNGTPDWQLPVPATFVIDQDRKIILAYADVDYRNRLEPADAIAALKELPQLSKA